MKNSQDWIRTIAVFSTLMLILLLTNGATNKYNNIDPRGATKIGANVYPISGKYYDAIARGDVDNCESLNKFGSNTDIDVGTEDIVDAGGTFVETLITTPAKIYLVSTDIDDDADLDAAPGTPGNGARTVTVFGLDIAGSVTSDTISMDGITPVASTVTFSFVYRMFVATAGTSLTNEGNISCTDNPSTEIYAMILTGNGQTLMAVYKVPTDHIFVMTNYYFSVGEASPSGVNVGCKLFSRNGGAYRITHRLGLVQGGTQSFNHPFGLPLVFSAGMVIKLTATVDANNTLIDAGFDGYTEDIS